MTRTELKEIITRVIDKLKDQPEDAPTTACLFDDGAGVDDPCDITTRYNVGEEA